MQRPVIRYMVIRAATLVDSAALAQVHVASWRAAYAHLLPAAVLAGLSVQERMHRWEQVLANTAHGMLVAVHADQVLGFAHTGASRDADGVARRIGELYALYVDPEHWGRGVGEQLWRAARQQLLIEEYPEATLWVLEGNQRARRFYEAAGLALDSGARQMISLFGNSLPEVRYRTLLA